MALDTVVECRVYTTFGLTAIVQKRLACDNRLARKTEMKRLLLISVISLLFVSGWSHVLAAALCPQMQVKASCPMQMRDHSPSSHEAMGMGEMGDIQMPETTVSDGEAPAVDLPIGSCSHCFSKSNHPTSTVVTVYGVEQSRRDIGAIVQQTIKAFSPLTSSFAPPITSRQHAPPGVSAPRHVLISVFLI